jgi:hypothetical protein
VLAFLGCLASAWLSWCARSEALPRLHLGTAAPAVAVFGLANPYLFGLGRAGVYEAAIEGAQCFLLAGLLMGGLAIGSAASSRRQHVFLALAGCAWGAALACRISLLLAIGGLVLATAWTLAWEPSGAARSASAALGRRAGAIAAFGWALQPGVSAPDEFGATHSWPAQLLVARFCRPRMPIAPAGRSPAGFPRRCTCRAAAMPPTAFAKATGHLSPEPVVGILLAAPCAVRRAARPRCGSSQGRASGSGAATDRGPASFQGDCLPAVTLLGGFPR